MLTQTGAIGGEEFQRLMTRLGPFEAEPELAVAVSGGADSMALCLLADAWARAQGGRIRALTVDHALRPESRDEAVQVGYWLARRGIAHDILTWVGDKPKSGIQAAARDARYALLQDWCARSGVLHLLLAHHQEDQAETVLLRLARGSGVDGLAGMSAVSELPAVRLLRPLLSIPKARLRETLRAADQPWVEDPSNKNSAFTRVRMRAFLGTDPGSPGRLAAMAEGMGRVRLALETACAELLARAVSLHEAGFALVDPAELLSASEELQLRVWSSVCRTIGGAIYPPRHERLDRLVAEMRTGLAARRTFSGCVLMPAKGRILVMREMRAVADGIVLPFGQSVLWDGRFRVSSATAGVVSALGAEGWREIRKEIGRTAIPSAVCPTLPALFVKDRVVSVPHLGFHRPSGKDMSDFRVLFVPGRALAQVGHCLV